MLTEILDTVSEFLELETFLNMRLVYKSEHEMFKIVDYKIHHNYHVWKLVWISNYSQLENPDSHLKDPVMLDWVIRKDTGKKTNIPRYVNVLIHLYEYGYFSTLKWMFDSLDIEMQKIYVNSFNCNVITVDIDEKIRWIMKFNTDNDTDNRGLLKLLRICYKYSKFDFVKEILSNNIFPGYNLLENACGHGNIEIVKFLIDYKKITITRDIMYECFRTAIMRGDYEMSKYLWNTYGEVLGDRILDLFISVRRYENIKITKWLIGIILDMIKCGKIKNQNRNITYETLEAKLFRGLTFEEISRDSIPVDDSTNDPTDYLNYLYPKLTDLRDSVDDFMDFVSMNNFPAALWMMKKFDDRNLIKLYDNGCKLFWNAFCSMRWRYPSIMFLVNTCYKGKIEKSDPSMVYSMNVEDLGIKRIEWFTGIFGWPRSDDKSDLGIKKRKIIRMALKNDNVRVLENVSRFCNGIYNKTNSNAIKHELRKFSLKPRVKRWFDRL